MIDSYNLYGRFDHWHHNITLSIKRNTEIVYANEFLLVENVPFDNDLMNSIQARAYSDYTVYIIVIERNTRHFNSETYASYYEFGMRTAASKKEFVCLDFEIYGNITRNLAICKKWLRKNKHNLPPVRIVEAYLRI